MQAWKVRRVDGERALALSRDLGLHRVTAECLVARGASDRASAEAFVRPKLSDLRAPVGLAGLDRAVERMARAVAAGETIGIFGDYDVDGVTTTALVTSYLRQAGAKVVPRVARRDAGYGFGVADAAALIDGGTRLIVTGDCGTSDRDAISAAAASGCDVIVIDHHTVPAASEDPHPAYALINPLCADSTFPFRMMASVGLGFYTMAALRTRLRQDGWFRRRAEPDLLALLDLVAIGTIADLVSLEGENRILVRAGLARLARRERPGLDALLERAGVPRGEEIDEETVAWKISPRINAPGRLGDATPSLDLLLADAAGAPAAAERLEQLNMERREAQQRVLAEVDAALAGTEPGPAVVIAGEGWPAGVVGIVAARLVDRYRRPAFVIAIDPETGIGRGSARTVDGIHLYQVLHTCRGQLERYGGHAGAAGLTVRRERVDELRAAIASAVVSLGTAASEPVSIADAEVELAEVGARLARELCALAPFGRGNAAPRLISRGVEVRSTRRVGDGSHLKLELADRDGTLRGAIAFGMGDRDPGAGARIDLLFHPVISRWNGSERVELEVADLAISQSGPAWVRHAQHRDETSPLPPLE